MRQLLRSLEAIKDIESIGLYIARDSKERACSFIDSVWSQCQLIACHPYMGRQCSELRRGLSVFPIGNYNIFYEVGEKEVLIVRILHSKRAVDRLF